MKELKSITFMERCSSVGAYVCDAMWVSGVGE